MPAWGALLLVMGLLLGTFASPVSRADQSRSWEAGGASRGISWMMNGAQDLTPDRAVFVAGHVELPWSYENFSWSDASEIAANGTAAPSMVANASGLGLRTNWSNYVRNPGFDSAPWWSYVAGPSGHVTARWNSSLDVGQLNSNWSGDQALWESMDHVVGTWTPTGGPAATAAVAQNGTSNPTPKQGQGTMGIGAVLGGDDWIGASNSSLAQLNWSAYDRLVVWVYINASTAASFNVTAHLGLTTTLLTTTAQALDPVRGWQEVVVDLTQLGDASVRSNLYQVGLRFNAPGTFPVNTWFAVDDARLGRARTFNETASFSQLMVKPVPTTPLPGSARLSFAWNLQSAGGAPGIRATVAVGPPGIEAFKAPLVPVTPGAWEPFSGDVSAVTAAGGYYNVTFLLTVAANTTAAYAVNLLVDNVTLVFPAAANGTFLSNVLSMGSSSQYLTVAWSGAMPASTTVTVGLRTGNNSVPGSGTWSGWDTTLNPGPTALAVPGALNFQLRLELNTTNASLSPTLQDLTLATRHRTATGNLTSGFALAEADFLRWKTVLANESLPAGTQIAFSIGNGSSLRTTSPGANLSTYGGGPRIQWSATLTTSDGLVTPTLSNVTLVYEYLGPPAQVVLLSSGQPLAPNAVVNLTSGQAMALGVLVYDAGSHILPSTDYGLQWSISNYSAGNLYPNGTFVAGPPGLYQIRALVSQGSSTTVEASVWVKVTSGPSPAVPLSVWEMWPLFAIAAAALIGFSAYELVIRRLFAIDDVFLIAKDGRLIIHNTRRMRADRDEDILSGMLTAIMAFLRDSDPEENGEFKKFEVGGKTTLLERGKHVYLTAVYSGRVPGWARKDLHRFMTDLEDRFGGAFASWSGSPEDLHGLKEYMQRFVTRVRYRGDSSARRTET